MPFSEISYYTGRIIEQTINRKYGEGSLRLKGQTAISDDITKFEFLSFSASDEMIEIKDKLSEIQWQLNLVIEEAKSKSEHKNAFGFKSEIDIPFTGGTLAVRPNELELVLKKRYAQMHPFLQNIIHTIQLYIR